MCGGGLVSDVFAFRYAGFMMLWVSWAQQDFRCKGNPELAWRYLWTASHVVGKSGE